MFLYIVCLGVSFGASAIGAICGIGGGVIIKPVLDSLGVMSVATVSFLSGVTVLSMTCYSVVRDRISGKSEINFRSSVPLAVGAGAGGVIGRILFRQVSGLFADQDMAGAVQAFCLAAVTLGTLIYTVRKDRVQTRQVSAFAPSCVIGLLLGIVSSFLGIGGGPINLAVLYYFFSMDTRTAAANSLFIILFSQAAGLAQTLVTGAVPEFQPQVLILMICGGSCGGIVGRFFSRRLSEHTVSRLFIILMTVIIGINIWNVIQFVL